MAKKKDKIVEVVEEAPENIIEEVEALPEIIVSPVVEVVNEAKAEVRTNQIKMVRNVFPNFKEGDIISLPSARLSDEKAVEFIRRKLAERL